MRPTLPPDSSGHVCQSEVSIVPCDQEVEPELLVSPLFQLPEPADAGALIILHDFYIVTLTPCAAQQKGNDPNNIQSMFYVLLLLESACPAGLGRASQVLVGNHGGIPASRGGHFSIHSLPYSLSLPLSAHRSPLYVEHVFPDFTGLQGVFTEDMDTGNDNDEQRSL